MFYKNISKVYDVFVYSIGVFVGGVVVLFLMIWILVLLFRCIWFVVIIILFGFMFFRMWVIDLECLFIFIICCWMCFLLFFLLIM